MGGAKIDCYIDCTSAYSHFALVHLRRLRPALAAHSVEVEIHPVFLGGINALSGNQPPWTLPVKAKYLDYDRQRACKYFGVEFARAPEFFPYLTVMPMRCMMYIKSKYPQDQYERCFLELFTITFYEKVDISKPEGMKTALARFFPKEDVEAIMAAASQKEWKDALTEQTKKIVDLGAFGCPWMIVTNGQGKVEPFFGSDRFHFIWEFLGLPWEDIKIKEPKDAKL